MPGSKHALLSPSSSHIWIKCPRSARLSEGIEDKGSDYARLGTCAHALCEYKLSSALGLEAKDPREGLEFLDDEMEFCSSEYAQYVTDTLTSMKATCKDPVVLIEQKIDFSKWVPEGFGYADCILVADKAVHVIDYKHGEGVLVDAKENSQMMCYALGAINLLDELYEIEDVSMTIFQPRRENVSTWTTTKEKLLKWADETLKIAANLAYKGEGQFCAGEHCRFCKVKNLCRARAQYNLELARYDFAMPETLKDIEISAILGKIDALVTWASDIKDYALSKALEGKHYEGFKVVEGRSNRKYTNEEEVASTVLSAGYDPYEKSVLGITAMTKMLGKKKFEELLGPLVYKAPGKPALVPEDDKRPALSSAKEDFNVMEE